MTKKPQRNWWSLVASAFGFGIIFGGMVWATLVEPALTTSGAGGGLDDIQHSAMRSEQSQNGPLATIASWLTAPSPTATATPERTPTPWVLIATRVPEPTSTPVDAYGSPACEAGETCRAFKRATVVTPVVWCDELDDNEIPTHGRECVARDAHGTWSNEGVGS